MSGWFRASHEHTITHLQPKTDGLVLFISFYDNDRKSIKKLFGEAVYVIILDQSYFSNNVMYLTSCMVSVKYFMFHELFAL